MQLHFRYDQGNPALLQRAIHRALHARSVPVDIIDAVLVSGDARLLCVGLPDGTSTSMNGLSIDDVVAIVTALVPDHHIERPEDIRARKIAEIDAQTAAAIARGFEFTGMGAFSGKPTTLTFSLSLPAQTSMIGLMADLDRVEWPFMWPDKDDTDAILIDSADEFRKFYTAAREAVTARKVDGAARKFDPPPAATTAAFP